MSTCSTTSSCPTITFLSSPRIRSRPSATFSAPTVASTSMRQRVDDFVDRHLVGHRREFDVAWELHDIRPFPAVAHVGVPVDEHHRPSAVVEDRPQMRDEAALLPRPPLHERADTRHLRIPVDLVEAAEDRMILGDVDDLAIGEDTLDLALEVVPFERSVKIVEHRAAAAEEELPQDRDVGIEQLQRARLDE